MKRQITKGKARGHKDPEIVEGVIYPTVPGSTLRKFLQSSEDLSVTTLLDILRAYFREADTVDLLLNSLLPLAKDRKMHKPFSSRVWI